MVKEEHKYQRLFVQKFKYLQSVGSIPKECIIFAVNNNHTTRTAGAIGLAMGQLAGVSDLIILTKKKTYFVELKVKKGVQSPYQKAFQQKIKELGDNYEYIICRDSFVFLEKLSL